ncbi:MAG TPA: prephenate dehydrogenase [Sporosarcina sp.]|nr:prephenate dehydrogenase [Sporosarcina sp.]
MKTHIAIVGLGLIGGSLGLALKRNKQITITGFDNSYETMQEAYRRGIIDHISASLPKVGEEADIIIFATPVNTTVRLMQDLPNWSLKKNVIITDTGSTKKPIMDAAQKLRDYGLTFVGGHPMAGSHKSGVTAAKAHLFENAYFVLTPFHDEGEQSVEILRTLLQPTKAKVVKMDATTHDRMTAVVSHFPHLIAASLVRRLAEQEVHDSFVRELAAGGFRDITRIASADPIMWRDITAQNKAELLAQLDGWTKEMDNIRTLLEKGDPIDIQQFFTQAKAYRDELPITSKGAMFTNYDLHVDIPDHPGVISEITKILADEEISITNIRIVETRTDVFGILVISFQSIRDRERAQYALQTRTDYSSHIM